MPSLSDAISSANYNSKSSPVLGIHPLSAQEQMMGLLTKWNKRGGLMGGKGTFCHKGRLGSLSHCLGPGPSKKEGAKGGLNC